jgi:hypothetical protein
VEGQEKLDRGWAPALAWACYLGSSWTWVIGLFLPILLLRDFGLWGWVAFAAPNVLGAALMGCLLTAPGSRRMATQHRDMCVRFSEVTIGLHAFVLGWLHARMFGIPVVVLALAAAWFVHASARCRQKSLVVGVWVTFASLGLCAAGLVFGWSDAFTKELWQPGGQVRLGEFDLWMFALAAVVGFGLCPYLDLTFHRARSATAPVAGRRAFALGFGAVFLTMIVLSLAYARMLMPLFEHDGDTIVIPPAWVAVLMVHLTMQASFTMGIHSREVTARIGEGAWLRIAVIVVIGLLAAVMVERRADEIRDGLTYGEAAYRIFLLAYGLAFPGYVFLCMIPTWRGATSDRTNVIVWGISTLVALPMAYMGFVLSMSIWIPGSLGVLCVGRVVLEVVGGRGRVTSNG